MVTNKNGYEISFDAAVALMDADIAETLYNSKIWDSDQEFFTAYERLHEEHFGEEWELSKANPTW